MDQVPLPTPLRVLIVEDDLSFRKIVEIRLKSWRPEISFSFAENISMAQDFLASAELAPELVILDQQLPDGMGWTLLEHPMMRESTVLAVSSDTSPELPGQTVKAGAQHFLAKRQVTEPLFIPLLDALLERGRLERELRVAELHRSQMQTIKTLLGTLRHEINNPLGAVMGATYIIKAKGQLDTGQQEAVALIESSGQRIKHVLEQLCEAANLELVQKATEEVFQVPGDPSWKEHS